MVGLSDLFWVYQNSGPALLFVLTIGGAYVYKHDLQPRLRALESTQSDRGDKWEEQRLNSNERTLLIDDNAERVDEVQSAVKRLKVRIRAIEQAYAVEHGQSPSGYNADDDGASGFDEPRADGGSD